MGLSLLGFGSWFAPCQHSGNASSCPALLAVVRLALVMTLLFYCNTFVSLFNTITKFKGVFLLESKPRGLPFIYLNPKAITNDVQMSHHDIHCQHSI